MRDVVYFIEKNDSTNLTPEMILEAITKQMLRNKEYEYLILGQVGPTGKTWLCDELRDRGFVAIEITQNIFDLVSFKDEKNHVRLDEFDKLCIIVLNAPINKSRA